MIRTIEMTQLRAQTVTTATLKRALGPIPAGTLVSLQWERSYRRESDGPLLHTYSAFGYSDTGRYEMRYATLADLENFGFSTGTK